MNISGALPASPVNASPNQDLSLRPFQRVTAQVLGVTGTTALLSIEGYPVVAQLSSADQAAELLTRQTADFIVTQLTGQKITLKIDKKDETARPPTNSNMPELAVRLLEQHNLPVTVNHLMVARSILKKNLPVTLDTFEEMLGALSAYGSWGTREADLAAALKADGLPVSTQSLKLAARQAEKIGTSISRLLTILTSVANQDLPADLLKELALSLKILNAVVLDGDAETSRLAEQLKELVSLLGTSIERTLLERSQNPDAPANNMLSLVRLQQMLEHTGKNEAAKAVGEFLSDLRLNQFLNAGVDHWSDINFASQAGQQRPDNEPASARLRIARDPEAGPGKIDPANTRLILQVDVHPGETVEVDVAIAGKQIRTAVTAAEPGWCQLAERELPTLAEALEGLGFHLKDTQIQVGKPQVFDPLKVVSDHVPL
ncbi:MAG TPA: hypothetical protein VHP14_05880, partial [Anaerolineales bacterium]|nr:hypothetical protein [Anaerolineales bacterium]